jgi:hypothetical protein
VELRNYLSRWTLSAKTLDLAISVNLVVFQDSEFGLLALVLDFLRSTVDLLLALLGTTAQAQNQVESRLFLNVIV